jgi:glycosyltransferase involved in cell wall biosynthesis
MRIGVVIAARDAAPWIGDAVGSVRAQTHRDWRLVVVDDGSADATADIAAEVAGGDGRIAVVRRGREGVSAARNHGRGVLLEVEAVIFLDADDWLAPYALWRLAECLRARPEAVAAAGACGFVAAEDGPGAWPRRLLYPPSGDIVEPLLERNLFANCGQVLIRAGALRQAGGLFRPDLTYGEDWEFLVRLALQGPVANLPRSESPVLFVRRRRSGACLSQAAELPSFAPCMEAIFTNPALIARFPANRLKAIRARAEVEKTWIIGRALLAQGRRREAGTMLRHALRQRPSARRVVLALAATLLPASGLPA